MKANTILAAALMMLSCASANVMANGTRVFEAKYDPWGVETVVRDSIGFHRGYGGHEMLNEFGIINMRSAQRDAFITKWRKNGRLYDPLLGRFLSPDNYVQEPFNTQNLNRYSYCLNNPEKYTDPDGEWFGLLPAIFGVGNMLAHKHAEGHWRLDHNLKYLAQGTLAGLAVNGISNWGHHIPFVGKIISNVATAGMGFSTLLGGYYGGRAILANWIIRGSKGFQLSKRIWLGQFYLDDNFARGFWEGFGRYTWEFPQTVVGHLYNQDYNTVAGADRVDYLDGATFVTKYSQTKGDGVTIGNFINIRNPERISGDFSSYVTKNQLYMHEYGHYIDSHLWGPSYLLCIGSPSLYSAIKAKMTKNHHQEHNHRRFWTEKRANRRAWQHFHNHHCLSVWEDSEYPRW
jgi:RHS repeat-associated protein